MRLERTWTAERRDGATGSRRRFLTGCAVLFGVVAGGAGAARAQTTDTVGVSPGWTPVAQSQQVTIEVHPGRITRDPAGYLKGWERWQYSQPARDSDGKSYVSAMVQLYYDCDGRRRKVLQRINYARNGSVVSSWRLSEYEQEWSDVAPDSIGEGALDEVCMLFGL